MRQRTLISTVLVVLLLLFALPHEGRADDGSASTPTTTTTTTTTATAATPTATTATTKTEAPVTTTKPQPKKIVDSAICKKCVCSVDIKQLDCNGKLDGKWFTDDEWALLQDGDIRFTTILLQHNNLTAVPVLPPYNDAENLFLGYNRIAEIAEAAFQNWTGLHVLDLSNNILTSKALFPDVFRGQYSTSTFKPLAKLRELNLGYNGLHTLHTDLFEHLPALENLILCKNTFQVIDQASAVALSMLASLKELDISYMELKELPDHFLHGPRDLETLILSGNLFTRLPIHMEYAQSLKRLVLDENPIASLEGDNIFPEMLRLEYLSMSYMPDITTIGAGAMNKLPNLTSLLLSSNFRLSDIDSKAFARPSPVEGFNDYPPLTQLYLHNNNLTQFHKQWIERWDKVTVLDVRFNPWQCDCSNSYLIHNLIPMMNTTELKSIMTVDATCASPAAYKDTSLLILASGNMLQCRDDRNTSASGSLVFVALLVGVIIGIPVTIGGMLLWRRGCFGLLGARAGRGPGSAYSRASFNEEFHI